MGLYKVLLPEGQSPRPK